MCEPPATPQRVDLLESSRPEGVSFMDKHTHSSTITSMLHEERVFLPPEAFQKTARVSSFLESEHIRQQALRDPDRFWAEHARKEISWFRDFDRVLDWQEPFARWFDGGELNISFNCLDRHIAAGRGDRTALLWEGEPGDTRRYTYTDLLEEVCRCANALKELGIRKGDRVTIYMPMIPEQMIALLACARIGATHSVVFGGFSAEALASRNQDAQSKLVITADGGYRRGQVVALKEQVDQALDHSPTVEKVLIVRRTNHQGHHHGKKARDYDWHDLLARQEAVCAPEPLESEHPLFILYTSGSTGKPKGILHTTAGYLLGSILSFKYVFDHHDEDVYWCTADIGWVTGHTYVVYGPLANGATIVMYEGAPNVPDPSRFWSIIERYKVSIFYTAPTAIRTFIKWGDEHVSKHDLSSLRLLGTVGEPINPEAWMWYHETIGKGRCPIVDTWWQTETGSIMIAPLPGATPIRPGTATRPFFGIDVDVVDKQGQSVPANTGGFLVIKRPWPSMLRTIFGDPVRYKEQYWSHIPGMYFTGDGARRDEHGNFWIMGRIDDVLNVSGHRLSTMEIESALVSHPTVAEAAVVGRPDAVKGEGIACFVTLEGKQQATSELKQELTEHVVKQIGALARPDEIRFSETLPKTRSGKIMRRLLRDIAAGRASTGDMTTLEDLGVLERLRAEEDEAH
jgi:acetyl-CoA synthetase